MAVAVEEPVERREAIVEYLERYAVHHALDIRFGTELHRVERPDDGGWRLETDGGPLMARYAVVATGYDAVPSVPDWPGRDSFAGELIHAAEFRAAAPYGHLRDRLPARSRADRRSPRGAAAGRPADSLQGAPELPTAPRLYFAGFWGGAGGQIRWAPIIARRIGRAAARNRKQIDTARASRSGCRRHTNDAAQDRNARGVAGRPRRAARGGEGANAPQRRAGP